MFDEDGLGNYGTDPARTRKSGDGREEMDEKDHEIAHIRITARNRKLAEFRANKQFAMDRRETVRILLLSHDVKPWREENVVRRGTESGVHPKDGRCSANL